MPEDDVSDLRDVFDAINRLCETMRTSTYEEAEEEVDLPPVDEVVEAVEVTEAVEEMEIVQVARVVECAPELSPPSAVGVRVVDAYRAERWSDAPLSPPVDDDETEAAPASDMYYTASSEVSLLSDGELPEKTPVEECGPDLQDREEKEKECVIAGHVAAMRERFESMTRTNTPCPDLARSTSPSLDVFRNITPSPDRLG